MPGGALEPGLRARERRFAPPRRVERPPYLMRLAGSMLVALLLLGAALWALPAAMDWNGHRGAIARFAAAQLGRPVHIDGPVSVAFLPAPVVTAERVRLGDRGDGISLAAPALQLRLAIAPLLLGRIVPRALVLSHPVIHLPWPLPPVTLPGARGWGRASVARIDDGRLDVGALHLSAVDALMRLGGAEPGSLTVGGTARLGGMTLRFDHRLGAADADGNAPFQATASLDTVIDGVTHAQDGGRFAGVLGHDGLLTGRLTAHVADLARLMPAPHGQAWVDGTLTLGADGATATLTAQAVGTALTLRTEPLPPGEAMTVTADRLDLDVWRHALSVRQHQPAGLPRLPWPTRVELTVAALQTHGGLLRDVDGLADLVDGRIVLRTATAVLPGEAALRLDGELTDAGAPGFAGNWTLDAPQLRRTLSWLLACGVRLPADLPPEVLRQAKLAGHVSATSGRIDLDAMTGTIEPDRVAGHIGVEMASGAVDAALRLDRLPADNWLPQGTVPDWPSLSERLAGVTLALKLRADQVSFRGETIRGVTLDAATDAGGLAINGADFDIDGLHGHLSGTIDRTGQLGGAVLDLGAAQAAGLSRQLPAWARFTDLIWAGPVHLHAEATGPRDAVIVSLGLDLADAHLEAHPTVNWAAGTWVAQMTLRHPGASRLLGAMGWPGAQGWLGEGSISLLAQLSGAPGLARVDMFDLTAGALHATGALQWTAGPMITGRISADTLPLPGLAAHDQDPVPIGWLRDVGARLALSANTVLVGQRTILHAASANLDAAHGTVELSGIKAAIGGGTLMAGVALASLSSPPRVTAHATILGATLDAPLFGTKLDFATGRFDAAIDLAGQGYSPQSVVASLSGAVHLAGAAGTLSGLGDPASPSLPTPFDTVDADAAIRFGIVTIRQAAMQGRQGATALSGAADLPDGTLNLLVQEPGRTLRLTGPIAAPRRAP